MNIAIIPARGGSKRIPRKNIKIFSGKPMIAYSIEAALRSQLFDRVIVSTDDRAITQIAKESGAEVPFTRPEELSDDHTPTAPVVKHALDWLIGEGAIIQYACCIYATAPFLQAKYLRRGYEVIRESKAASVFSVTTFPFPIFRALRISGDGSLAMFWPEHELTRSNDLPDAYHDAGQFYWLDAERFRETPKLYTPDAVPVILPRHLVQDIDTPEDWETAEKMYEALGR